MSVLDAYRNVVDDYEGGAKAMAGRLGVQHKYLLNQMEGAGYAKIGLLDAVKVTRYARDPRILNAFAEECGYLVIAMPSSLLASGDEQAVELVTALAKELGDVSTEFCNALADNRCTDNELAGIERQGNELIAATQRLMAFSRLKNQAGKPPHEREGGE